MNTRPLTQRAGAFLSQRRTCAAPLVVVVAATAVGAPFIAIPAALVTLSCASRGRTAPGTVTVSDPAAVYRAKTMLSQASRARSVSEARTLIASAAATMSRAGVPAMLVDAEIRAATTTGTKAARTAAATVAKTHAASARAPSVHGSRASGAQTLAGFGNGELRRVRDHKIADHGYMISDYFQGCGTSFTSWEDVGVGVGGDAVAAYNDALDQLHERGWNVDDLPKRPPGLSKKMKVPAKYDESYWYICVYVK